MSSAPPPQTRAYWIIQTDLSTQDWLRLPTDHKGMEWISKTTEIQISDRIFLWDRIHNELFGEGVVVNRETDTGKQSGIENQDRLYYRLARIFVGNPAIGRSQIEGIINPGNRGNPFENTREPIRLTPKQTVAIKQLLEEPDEGQNGEVVLSEYQSDDSSQESDLLNQQPSTQATGQSAAGESKSAELVEDVNPSFNELLVNIASQGNEIERTEKLYELAMAQAKSDLLDQAGLAFRFALSAAEKIQDVFLQREWMNRIRGTAKELGILMNSPALEEASQTAPVNKESGQTVATDTPVETEPHDTSSRISSFDADIYSDKDLLGIEDDVEAFAKLIAARSIEPPLSIGLFGDWGSGKTFFMRHLKRRVEQIAGDADVSGFAQKDIAFYKRIIQIEFNAWHYSESNLWASMVEHIFQNLRLTEHDKPDDLEKRRNAILKKIEIENIAHMQIKAEEEKAKATLQNKKSELRNIVSRQQQELKKLEELAAKDILGSVKTSIKINPPVEQLINETLVTLGIEKVGDSATELQASMTAARSVLTRATSLFLPLSRATDRGKRITMLLLVLLGAPTIAFLLEVILTKLGAEGAGRIYAFFSGVATFLSAAAWWVHKQVEWISRWLGKVETAKELVDQQIAEQVSSIKATHEKEIVLHQQQLEMLNERYTTLRKEREEAERRVELIQEELRQTTPVQWLAKFIQDRASSDDYRKHLGLLALIRRDFEKLSMLLDAENKKLLGMEFKEEQVEKVSRINRIVLYIDDLDRCQPSQVVAVLQAVHLLLAFKLFIVVVGVDCRWVTQSLKKQYPELLRDSSVKKDGYATSAGNLDPREPATSMATSRDYLEKIFQIPFWLNPMNPKSTVKLLNGILGDSVVREERERPVKDRSGESQASAGEQADQSQEGTGESESQTPDPSTGERAESTGETREKRGRIKLEKFDLNPKSLDLREREMKFMESLASLLGRSPRSVKRFINIYRLIKVSRSPGEQREFLKARQPIAQYQAVMLLLVIETSLPAISAELFSILQSDYQVKIPSGNLNGLLNYLFGDHKENRNEVERLQEWLKESHNEKLGELELSQLADWAPLISRYSFNSERT